MQFQAGYIADAAAQEVENYRKSLSDSPEDVGRKGQIEGLLRYVSTFNVDFRFNYKAAVDHSRLHPVLAVLNNIICRGLPTRSPEGLEKHLELLGLTIDTGKKFEIEFQKNEDVLLDFDKLFRLLHLIEPGLSIDRSNYGGHPGSDLEWSYIREHPWLLQILQSQRDFESINRLLTGGRTVDYSYSPPYLFWDEDRGQSQKRDYIVEIDGHHHLMSYQKYYDQYRDDAADIQGFSTLRRTEVLDPMEVQGDFIEAVGREHFELFQANHAVNIQDELPAYSLLFIPFAVARIQKTLIECLNARPELLALPELKLAIIERDVPCGGIAVKLLEEMLAHLDGMIEDAQRLGLPSIELHVFPSEQWTLDLSLHADAVIGHEDNFNPAHYDLILDHSILRRSDIYNENTLLADKAVCIRSAHFVDRSFGQLRRTHCAELLNYTAFVDRREDGSYKRRSEESAHLTYFLQAIFRKKEFREGQIPILSRALQNKPVIGLLPTGGGKSLTFQLAAFLQPGLCVVVDPIKSLMEDQVRVLNENWIDCCSYINSNISTEKRKRKLIDFRYGEHMFLFVSPERFVIEEFRSIVAHIDSNSFGLAISYAVIDEVHCVSEWGHDFRTTYLMLGHNAQKFCKTRDPERKVNLIGLTATASFDVLADVERELQIQNDDVADAIIMVENTIRPELFFRILDCSEGSSRVGIFNEDFRRMGANLAMWNEYSLLEDSIKHHRQEFENKDLEEDEVTETRSEEEIVQALVDQTTLNDTDELRLLEDSPDGITAITFCMVKGEKGNEQGVKRVHEQLDSRTKTFFYSTDDSSFNEVIQKNFNDFIYGRKRHMVCTKAFGMGIDKKDVRSVYHYTHSGSLESFVQEAGRAGRDKKVSEAVTLFSRKKSCTFLLMQFFGDHFANTLIHTPQIRKELRRKLHKYWDNGIKKYVPIRFDSINEARLQIQDMTLFKDPTANDELTELLLSRNESGEYRYLMEHGHDRGIHDFFHSTSFKGAGVEKSQFLNAFLIKEFSEVNGDRIHIPQQEKLVDELTEAEEGEFEFVFTFSKVYENANKTVAKILKLDPAFVPYGQKNNAKRISDILTFSSNFEDFLFELEEKLNVQIQSLTQVDRSRLLLVFGRDRSDQAETGRLIYRMYCMGFLKEFEIDYRNKIFKCTLHKDSNIDHYVRHVNEYLARYQSQLAADVLTEDLRGRLSGKTYEDQILECLNFLSEFAYREIVSKRLAATDEIERVLMRASSPDVVEKGPYEQNRVIKEDIYFYFNAKYARLDFRIDGQSYSLLGDFNEQKEKTEDFEWDDILFKYLGALEKGLEQNNYKHMIGSCRKIQRSLSASDSSKEWLLHLLLAFALYAVGQASYLNEANDSIIRGFRNLYRDKSFHNDDWSRVDVLISRYFDELSRKLEGDNQAFASMQIIRLSVLAHLQDSRIKELLLN